MTDDDLRKLLTEAAQQGATNALARIGLHDDEAGHDVRELRGLLDAYRDVKKGIRQQIGRTLLAGLLAFVLFMAGHQWRNWFGT